MRFRQFLEQQQLDASTQTKIKGLTLSFLKTLNDGQVTNQQAAMAYVVELLSGKDEAFNQMLNTTLSQPSGSTQADKGVLPTTAPNMQTPTLTGNTQQQQMQANPQGFTR